MDGNPGPVLDRGAPICRKLPAGGHPETGHRREIRGFNRNQTRATIEGTGFIDGRPAMARETQSSRREFIGALGLGVAAGVGIAPGETSAQAAKPARIVDFHNHYMGPSWTLTNLNGMPPKERAAWEKINANLQSPDALLGSVEIASITARV